MVVAVADRPTVPTVRPPSCLDFYHVYKEIDLSSFSFLYIILHNATRVGKHPMLRADGLHAYVLTRSHACMLTC